MVITDQGAVAANEYLENRNEKGDAARMQVFLQFIFDH